MLCHQLTVWPGRPLGMLPTTRMVCAHTLFLSMAVLHCSLKMLVMAIPRTATVMGPNARRYPNLLWQKKSSGESYKRVQLLTHSKSTDFLGKAEASQRPFASAAIACMACSPPCLNDAYRLGHFYMLLLMSSIAVCVTLQVRESSNIQVSNNKCASQGSHGIR